MVIKKGNLSLDISIFYSQAWRPPVSALIERAVRKETISGYSSYLVTMSYLLAYSSMEAVVLFGRAPGIRANTSSVLVSTSEAICHKSKIKNVSDSANDLFSSSNVPCPPSPPPSFPYYHILLKIKYLPEMNLAIDVWLSTIIALMDECQNSSPLVVRGRSPFTRSFVFHRIGGYFGVPRLPSMRSFPRLYKWVNASIIVSWPQSEPDL